MRSFADRATAGRALGTALRARRLAAVPDVVVLGLPRGGVPVAAEVAAALGAPVDALVVRKLGVPEQPELAMGAVGPGGVVVRNEQVITNAGVSPAAFEAVLEAETAEIARREALYRKGRAAQPVRGRVVVLVDDGLATGATMRAAIAVVCAAGAGRVIVAVPVAPRSTCEQLSTAGAGGRPGATAGPGVEVVALLTPSHFRGVGAFYADFSDPDDNLVRRLAAGGAAAPGMLGWEP